MKHLLFDMLFSVAGLLLAIRLTHFWNSQDNDIGRLPVNLFPVYSSIHGTAIDQQLMAHVPHFCSVSILRASLRFKDHRSGKRSGLSINQTRCISNSEKNFSTGTSLKVEEVDATDPLQHHDYFNVRELVTLDDLFRHNVHLGHTHGCRNKYMTPYLFGSRLGSDIIDLEQTLPLFQDALNFTAHIAYQKGIILFISRNKQMMPWVERSAKEVGEYAHCRYWKGGLYTDSTKTFGTMTRLPDLGIFFCTLNNAFRQHRGVIDHAKLLIPTIGICDSNTDPRLITYPIPGNDDSKDAQLYYLSLFKEAILRGKTKRTEDEKLGLFGSEDEQI